MLGVVGCQLCWALLTTVLGHRTTLSNTSDTQLPYFDWSCRSENRLTWEHFLHMLNLSRLKCMRALELGNHVRYFGERNVSDGNYKHMVHEKNDTKEVATKN